MTLAPAPPESRIKSKQTALELEKRYRKHCVNNLDEVNGTQLEGEQN